MWYWIAQSICYNILWILCITFPKYQQKKQLIFAIILLIIQFFLLKDIVLLHSMMMLILFVGGNLVAGLLILSSRYFYQPKRYFPFWLILIWASFTLYSYPLLWLYRQHFIWIAMIMFFSFGFVYYLAIVQKAIFVRGSEVMALLSAGIAYALFFAGLIFLYSKVSI